MINSILSRATIGQPTPTVGMGATFLSYSDRNPGTITYVTETRQGTVVWVQHDRSKCVAGSSHDGSAQYEFIPNPEGAIEKFRFEDGKWRAVMVREDGRGYKLRRSTIGLRIGERDEYRDPSF